MCPEIKDTNFWSNGGKTTERGEVEWCQCPDWSFQAYKTNKITEKHYLNIMGKVRVGLKVTGRPDSCALLHPRGNGGVDGNWIRHLHTALWDSWLHFGWSKPNENGTWQRNRSYEWLLGAQQVRCQLCGDITKMWWLTRVGYYRPTPLYLDFKPKCHYNCNNGSLLFELVFLWLMLKYNMKCN